MQDTQRKISVLFTAESIDPLSDQIIISAVSDGWNDFGFKIRGRYSASLGGGKNYIEGHIFIGFLPKEYLKKSKHAKHSNSMFSLNGILEEAGRSTLKSEDAPLFFTMLPDMSAYRQLVKSLGTDEAERFLYAVKDLVLYKQIQESWVELALSSEVFSHGFMRDSEPFFAFNNADSVLGGVEEEDFSAISQNLNLTFSLEGYKNQHEVEFRFSNDSLIPRRINILIGKNGTGKSQALKNFCRAALRYKDAGLKLIDTDREDGRPMISRILAIATPGETGNTFPPERKKTQKLFYRRLNLTRNSRSVASRSIGDALVQLARSNKEIGQFSRWDLFIEALENVLPIDSIVIAKKGDGFVPIKSLTRGNESAQLTRWSSIDRNSEPQIQISEEVYPLSSGQLTFFKFCLLCCLYIENGSIILMDEPETHMHPNLISNFVGLLDYLLQNTGSQAILATHSAYFVREVPKEQVHVFFESEQGVINVVNPRLLTFGATVDAISQFVFGEDSEVRLTDKIYEKIKGRSFESVDEVLGTQLSLAALMDLRRRMEEEN